MQAEDRMNEPIGNFRFDGYTISRDIIKNWKVIVMLAVAIMLLSYSYLAMNYTKTYTMTTTFTVTSRGSSNDTYSNMNSAYDTATEFTQIINSTILQKKVAEAIGLDYMPGTVTAEVVENTNLMTLKVTENTPKLSYDVMHAVLENYNTISDSLLGSVVLNILAESEIPSAPDVAFAPKNLMLKALCGSLLVFILLTAVISFFKDTIRKEKEIEQKLDTKRLATLYHENKYKSLRSRLHKKKSGILITDPTVSFRYSESVKKLAARVENKMAHRHAKTILVTSVMENEGKSTVAANLALALSETSKKVLLLDGDFRKPALYKLFGVDPDSIEDFGEVLNGKMGSENLIMDLEGSELKLILNAVMYPDSTEMLSEGLLKKVIDYLETQLDYIVIDSSPMSMVADTEEMLDMIDSVLLVVKQHMATVADINDVIDVINRRKMKLVGCVFNDAGGESLSIGHGYGGYGGYGNYGYGKYGYGSYGGAYEKAGADDER